MNKFSAFTGMIQNELSDLKSELFGSVEKLNSGDHNSGGNGASNSDIDPKEHLKNIKEERKKEEAAKLYQKERQKKHEKEEYKREKFRDAIREKYGIEKKDCLPDYNTIREVKKDYNMSEMEFEKFERQVVEEQSEKRVALKKIDRKLEKRKQKKEIKKNLKDSCNTQ